MAAEARHRGQTSRAVGHSTRKASTNNRLRGRGVRGAQATRVAGGGPGCAVWDETRPSARSVPTGHDEASDAHGTRQVPT